MFRITFLILIVSLIAGPAQAGEPAESQRATLSITLRIPPRPESQLSMIENCMERWRQAGQGGDVACKTNSRVMTIEDGPQGRAVSVMPI